MKKSFLFFLLSGLVLLAAETIHWDFGSAAHPNVAMPFADRYSQTFEFGIMPDGTPALRLSYLPDAEASREFELHVTNFKEFPVFDKATVRMRIYVPESAAGCTVRCDMLDRIREYFTLEPQPVCAVPGWQTLCWEIDTTAEHPEGHGGIYCTFLGRTTVSGAPQHMDQPMTLNRMYVENLSAGSWLGIGSITIDVHSASSAILPALETATRVHVVTPGTENRLSLDFLNPLSRTYKGRFRYTVRNTDGNELASQSGTLDMQAGETVKCPVDCPAKYGVYYLDVESESDGLLPAARSYRFAYMNPTGTDTPLSPDGFLMGCVTHPFTDTRNVASDEAEAAALCGIRIIREGAKITMFMTPEEDFFTGNFDAAIAPYLAKGIEFQPFLESWTEDWILDPNWIKLDPEKYTGKSGGLPRPELWRKFARLFAAHYKNTFRFIEVWNEADWIFFANFDADTYLNLLKIASEEIRREAPNALILSTGYAGIPKTFSKDEHMIRVLADGRDYFDVLAYHGHGQYDGYRKNVAKLQKIIGTYAPGTPWYANETAISSTGTTEMEQAMTLVKKVMLSWSAGAIGYTWYDLRNDGWEDKFKEHNFGMITQDFFPKAVYGVYNNLAALVTGSTFICKENPSENCEGFWFRRANGERVYVAYTLKKDLTVETDFNAETAAVEKCDLFGNRTPVQSVNGLCHAIITYTPTFYIIK